eukprot:04038.XXX_151000_147129_1 [CDS] Oithona nana genome sequencing.
MLLPSPNELLLEGPYDKDRRIMFTLMNEYGENQAYKIKSTDPEIITVSPSSGFVRAFDRVEVLVTVAGNRVDPMIRDKEKFLIQSAMTNVPSSKWTSTSPREVLRNAESKVKDVRLLMRFLPLPVALKGNDEDNEFLKGGGDKNSSETSDSQQSHSGFVQAAAVQALLQQEDPNDSAPRKNKTKPKEEKVKLAAAAVVPTTLTATSCLQQQETKTLERGEDVAIRTGTGHNNQKIKELGERVTALEASWKSR